MIVSRNLSRFTLFTHIYFLFVWISERNLNDFYHSKFSDYFLHFSYILKVFADMPGLLQVFLKPRRNFEPCTLFWNILFSLYILAVSQNLLCLDLFPNIYIFYLSEFLRWTFMIFIIQNFLTIVFIFLIIFTTFPPICPAFFRCFLSPDGTSNHVLVFFYHDIVSESFNFHSFHSYIFYLFIFMNINAFYHSGFSDHCLYFNCYIHNIFAKVSGLLHVFLEPCRNFEPRPFFLIFYLVFSSW